MASKREERMQEIYFRVMRLLEKEPSTSTREIAMEVSISNGSAHYCVTALIDKGFIKLKNFAKSNTKASYLYELTPLGIQAKAILAVQFLERKKVEYINLKNEIERLENELDCKEEELSEQDRSTYEQF